MAKFHEKAIAIFAITQIAENLPAVISAANVTGTLTSTTGSAAVVGVGTSFLLEATPGAYLFDASGTSVGRILSVADNLNLTLEANGAVAITAAGFAFGLGPKNAVAALNMNYSTELETETFEYTGDDLSRDEITTLTDKFAIFDFETILPKLGTIQGSDPTLSEVPLLDFMTCAGMGVVLSTGSQGTVTYTNSVSTNSFLTVEVRRSSPEIVTDKAFLMENCRGTLDLNSKVGSKARLKFNFTGNLASVTQKPSIISDFGNQKKGFSVNLNSQLISLSRLNLYSNGVAPADSGATNFCFDDLTAVNLAGFEYDRFQVSCFDGWSKGATATDVVVNIIEDEAGAIYNPDDNISQDHDLVVRYGAVAGEKVDFYFHKLQLSGIAASTVAKFSGQGLTYRNVGTFDLVLG